MIFVCDIDKEETYVDSNGVTWWGSKYQGQCNVLKLYKPLEGVVVQGIEVVSVFKEDKIIKVKVSCDEDLTGLYLCPKIVGTLDDDKHITEVSYNRTTLDVVPLSENFSVEGLKGFEKEK